MKMKPLGAELLGVVVITVLVILIVCAWFLSNTGRGYDSGALNRMTEKERVLLTRFKWMGEKETFNDLEREKISELNLLTWEPYHATLLDYFGKKREKEEGAYQSSFEGVRVEGFVETRIGEPTLRVSYYDVPRWACEQLVEKVLHPMKRPYRINGPLDKCQSKALNKLDIYFTPLQE